MRDIVDKEVIEVDELDKVTYLLYQENNTNNREPTWAVPNSGLKKIKLNQIRFNQIKFNQMELNQLELNKIKWN